MDGEICNGESWTSPSMKRAIEAMRSENLTISAFRDRRGRLRYVYSNNETLHPETFRSLMKRGFLEACEPPEEANKQGEAHYRLK
jgi:hypothetical protein